MSDESGGATRDLDLVLFGATGFVGRLTAEHLATRAPEGLRVALAGRSLERLEELRAELGVDWPLLEVDALDTGAVAALAARTRVVATTVGPYASYGSKLVEACASAGTHYADLTGEVLFVRDTIDRCEAVARETGARIIHACGFDSVPSDLGVLVTAERARADGAGDLGRTTLHVRSMRGGFSGGTIDSMRGQAVAARSDPAARRIVADSYSLSPRPPEDPAATTAATTDDEADDEARGQVAGTPGTPGATDRVAAGVRRIARGIPVRRDERGHWTGPFVMASFNTRIVRRSNALLDWAYGRRFRYAEVMDFGSSPASALAAAGVTAGLVGLVAGMSFSPTRKLLDRVLPSPGEGPSEQTRASGRFVMEILATTSSGARYRTVVAAESDPGYGGTAVMLGQSALCLALDEDRLPDRAGILTPATGMGDVLADRLRAEGFTLETTRVS